MALVVLRIVIGAPTKLLKSLYLSSCKGNHILIPHFGLTKKLTSRQVCLFIISPVIADVIFLFALYFMEKFRNNYIEQIKRYPNLPYGSHVCLHDQKINSPNLLTVKCRVETPVTCK